MKMSEILGAKREDIIKLYTEKMGIPLKTLNIVNSELKLEDKKLTALAKPRRSDFVKEAISWESGPNQDKRKITKLYSVNDYVIAVGKPGKEAAPDYKGSKNYKTGEKTNNPNDMNPQIIKSGERIEGNLTFEDMFEMIEHLMHSDIFGLELLGMLLFRAAFMLDHKKNKEGNWRYYPSEKVLSILEKRIPMVSDIPIRVFIYFLEVLALNEDVKVYTMGHDDFKDYGRINTLLTFVNLIAVLLNRRSLSKFAGSLTRPPSGMAPIRKTKISLHCFPLMSPLLFNDS